MAGVTLDGRYFEYELEGPADAEPLLLINGVAGQLTFWPQGLVDGFIERGFRVLRYDPRDVGLSYKLDDAGLPDFGAIMAAVQEGRPAPVAYHLDDMAADAIALLDALDIPAAHVFGASMGGQVAQLVAADYPDRVLSFTAVMATTANPELPEAAPEVMGRLAGPQPDPTEDLDVWVDHMIGNFRITQSPQYPFDEATVRAQLTSDYHRSFDPGGFARQYAAILAAYDRRPKLQTVTAPTLVIHGEEDPLVPVACGRDIAANVPGSELLVIPGMGHDFPPELHGQITDAVAALSKRATARPAR